MMTGGIRMLKCLSRKSTAMPRRLSLESANGCIDTHVLGKTNLLMSSQIVQAEIHAMMESSSRSDTNDVAIFASCFLLSMAIHGSHNPKYQP